MKNHRRKYDEIKRNIKDVNIQKPFHTHPMSIIVVIKNRTDHIYVDYVNHPNGIHYNGTNPKGTYPNHPIEKKYRLQLFHNNLNALFTLLKPRDKWELIVVDFNSTDVDMAQFLSTTFEKYNNPENFTYRLISIADRFFNKGKGLNIGAAAAQYELLFFLDADMILGDRAIIKKAYEICDKRVYFPICMNYENPEHTTCSPRPSGKGNVFIRKSFLSEHKWPEYEQWGLEDDHFYVYFVKKNMIYRDCSGTFFHQWHPNTYQYKNKYYRDPNKNNNII